MIKRLRFVSRRAGLSVRDFSAAWVEAVALATLAPPRARPLRTVACTTLHDVEGTEAPHDGISIEWFADMAALRRFKAWLNSRDGQGAVSAAGLIDAYGTKVFLAEERVLRGADWLASRWETDAVKLKHMALARRAEGLSAAQFSTRWRNRSGTLGGANGLAALVIPEPAKGRAYVQNHAVLRAVAPRGYDAVNEVYFDDLAAMRCRIDFFSGIDVAQVDADLVSEAVFVAVTEQVIQGSRQEGPYLSRWP